MPCFTLLNGRYFAAAALAPAMRPVLTSSFLVLLSWAITKPLARLTNGMKEAQDQNFQLQLENDRGDEIGELTDSFNFMVNRINILVNQVYQERLAQKNAELEALQAQINPHFLYNTLDSINWMLISRGEMDISAIVVALGKLMQYSMDTHTRQAGHALYERELTPHPGRPWGRPSACLNHGLPAWIKMAQGL